MVENISEHPSNEWNITRSYPSTHDGTSQQVEAYEADQDGAFQEKLRLIFNVLGATEQAAYNLMDEAFARFTERKALQRIVSFGHDLQDEVLIRVAQGQLASINILIPNYAGTSEIHDFIVSTLTDPQEVVLEVPLENLGQGYHRIFYTPTKIPTLYIQTLIAKLEEKQSSLPPSKVVGKNAYEHLLPQFQQSSAEPTE